MEDLVTRLGITLPIIQAPMAGAQDWELCAAVSKAGGLGSLPCAMLSAEQIADQVKKIRASTNAPFNLNFFCHEMPVVKNEVLRAWQSQFVDEYQRFDITEDRRSSGKLRSPFDENTASLIEAIAPPVVSFHFGLPSEQLLSRVRETGAIILSSATTLREAEWLAEKEIDAIILQGIEAGGHRGMFLETSLGRQVSTCELLGLCRERIERPLIVAGGIGDAELVKELLKSGADAIQVGTAYLLCDEAKTSSVHRQALQQATENNTVITNVFSGRPARGITNGLIKRLGAMNELAPPFPYASLASAALRQEAEKQGINDFTPLWSGTNTEVCKQTSAAQITIELTSAIDSKS